MRRLTLRILFAVLVASSSLALVIGCIRIAEAQTRPGRGGGGAGGVALQPSAGTPQVGDANVTAVWAGQHAPWTGGFFGCSTTGTGGCSTTIQFKSAANGFSFDDVNGVAGGPYFTVKNAGATAGGWYANGISISGGLGNPPVVGSIYGAPINLISSNGPINTDTGGFVLGSGNLLTGKNNGVQKYAFDFAGTLITAVPVPQSSGGTGVGAVTCTAGQFLTSNGTAYSCAAPSSASAYTTLSVGPISLAAISGSLCSIVNAGGATGLVLGQGCVASANTLFAQSIALTLTCEVNSATAVSIRVCNTGTNTNTPPANTTYFARVFP